LQGSIDAVVHLAGANVTPRRLMEAGFSFRHPNLEAALRELLGKSQR